MAKKPAKPKIREASAMIPEPPYEGEKRLTDLEHLDELNRMVSRMHGLEGAILGACDSDTPSDQGLYQLVTDVTDAMKACAAAFEAERQRRIAEQHA